MKEQQTNACRQRIIQKKKSAQHEPHEKPRVNSLRCSSMVSSSTSETRRENVSEQHFYCPSVSLIPSQINRDTISLLSQ